jgi:site-specific DNA recombinase
MDRLGVALYCRVSTTGQEEDGSSLLTQEQLCRKYTALHRLPVDERYVLRETASAGTRDRPLLAQLREAIRAKAITGVVVYAWDRLSRNQLDLAVLVDEMIAHNVTLHCVTEPFEETAVGKFLMSTRAFVAEVEREKIRERSMRGKRARLSSGKLFNYGTHLYGYRPDKERGTRIICEPEAAVVREMFRWVAEEQCSLKEVTRRLMVSGHPPPGTGKFKYADPTQPRTWVVSQVRRMLQNPAYKGVSYALRYTADHHKAGRPEMRPEEEWMRLPDGLTPPIVAPDLWDAVQRQLATNVGNGTRNVRNPTLLRGFVFCPRCGRKMYPEPLRGHLYYRCGSRQALVKCDAPMLVGTEIETWAWERVTKILLDPRLIAAGVVERDQQGMTDALAKDRDTARRNLRKIEEQQRRLLERFSSSNDSSFPWELVEEKIRELQRERARWQETIRKSDAVLAESHKEDRKHRDLDAWCRRVAANLPHLTLEEKRLALSVLGVRVVAAGRNTRTWRIEIRPEGLE